MTIPRRITILYKYSESRAQNKKLKTCFSKFIFCRGESLYYTNIVKAERKIKN